MESNHIISVLIVERARERIFLKKGGNLQKVSSFRTLGSGFGNQLSSARDFVLGSFNLSDLSDLISSRLDGVYHDEVRDRTISFVSILLNNTHGRLGPEVTTCLRFTENIDMSRKLPDDITSRHLRLIRK